MDAAGPMDAQNAPTGPWKTAPNAVSHSVHTHRLGVDSESLAAVAVARKHGLPVLVDAAGQLPDGLRRLIASGAALVSSSGGKGLRGPQSTGILCGRTDYIASVALQTLDMDEYFEIWDPPEDLIPKSRLRAVLSSGPK